MRFEHAAAYAMGIGLPLLEALRRRTNFDTIAGYVDDFIAGALLLWAARAVSLRRPNAGLLLAAAWGVLCGGLYSSFFGQLDAASDVSGLPNAIVVAVKGALYAVALVALWRSVQRAGAAS
jgi:uncharacterized membrane protein YeaQ/YmgE (transglycosylase-associated protein family)